ncbi:hypothetical protein F183_A52980 [Bryobacterales bacterium F-183]|nr:hypothetical protein F183_A52980 [Bryobacterales bacterium F-183]
MVVRFGLFEFDKSTRELRREGKPVRLQAQPALALEALLNTPGEVVSRDTLRQAIWGDATHGEFESGINVCIGQVRAALGDSAESPIYIRTVPKRGYQFLAPVVEEQAQLPTRRSLGWPAILAAPAILLTAGLYTTLRPAPKVRIGIARFENQTGDPALNRFADGLTDVLTAELARQPNLECIANAPLLRQQRGFQNLDRINQTLNVGYVILGQVQGTATEARILLHLIRFPDQAHLWVTRADRLDLSDAKALDIQSAMAARATKEFLSKLPI